MRTNKMYEGIRYENIFIPTFYQRKFKYYVLMGTKKKSVWGNMRKSVYVHTLLFKVPQILQLKTL